MPHALIKILILPSSQIPFPTIVPHNNNMPTNEHATVGISFDDHVFGVDFEGFEKVQCVFVKLWFLLAAIE